MKCNCSNWDNDSPCPVHKDGKLQPSKIREETVFVIKVYRKFSNKRYFATLAKDAIQIFKTKDFIEKEIAILNVYNELVKPKTKETK